MVGQECTSLFARKALDTLAPSCPFAPSITVRRNLQACLPPSQSLWHRRHPPKRPQTSLSVVVAPPTLADAFDVATRARPRTARASRTVLVLFSGPYERPDGLAVFLRRLGFLVELVDNDPRKGGGATADLTSDAFYAELLQCVIAGELLAIIAAPPCSTFSISRFIPHLSSPDGRGPPVLRRSATPTGIPDACAA
jgi:hypothetical protein